MTWLESEALGQDMKERTTKGRLTALTNRMEGKANKSEVRQTAETLTSQIDRIQEESFYSYFNNDLVLISAGCA